MSALPGEDLSVADGRPRCAHCRDVIGAYEPLVRVVGDLAERTSRAARPDIVAHPHGRLYHAVCYEEIAPTAPF
jgi:hypothetical protein